MSANILYEQENKVVLEMTKRTDELLHMILDLKQNKDVDLYRMQTLVLNMYKDDINLTHAAFELERQLDSRKRKVLELPSFMAK